MATLYPPTPCGGYKAVTQHNAGLCAIEKHNCPLRRIIARYVKCRLRPSWAFGVWPHPCGQVGFVLRLLRASAKADFKDYPPAPVSQRVLQPAQKDARSSVHPLAALPKTNMCRRGLVCTCRQVSNVLKPSRVNEQRKKRAALDSPARAAGGFTCPVKPDWAVISHRKKSCNGK